ncbi:hypothetical protein [Adonisia turfae]|uniref:Secreted protein n=1 Tax=Adonisia turfae CCMR0081 TaxID=2292702 RepID=A0A6M0RNK8_9CYAN|nr:hypothetical protein [Adonisia turfae]NEZ57470.1 hypothetical protein [Adonisia turfae CCMR0081]
MLRFKLHHLFALSLLVTAIGHRPAQAMGVNFDLETQPKRSQTSSSSELIDSQPGLPETDSPSAVKVFKPLPIPPTASQPPLRITSSKSALPSHVIASARVLTPPPPSALPTSRVLSPNPIPSTPIPHDSSEKEAIALNFTPDASIFEPSEPSPPQPLTKAQEQPALPNWMYEGGSNSLVARVIGSAEGTRTANGNPTQAYYGHTDPGNGVWNMGTFSYQHGASSPQEADKKQLKRLKRQGKTIANQADQAELSMTLGEVLNGLDLANQSPRAALERGGYVDRLVQARHKGMKNNDAIVWARTYSYLDPDTQRWNAPGLGNTLTSIRRDQRRRHDAVATAFNSYQAQRDDLNTPSEETLKTPILALAPEPSTNLFSTDKTSQEKKLLVTQPTDSTSLAFSIHDDWESSSREIQSRDVPIAKTYEAETDAIQAKDTLKRGDDSQDKRLSIAPTSDPEEIAG